MNKLMTLLFALMALAFSAQSVEATTYYIIEKVNKGTPYLKPGQTSAGYVNNNSICGAKGGEQPGAEACAVVTPIPHMSEPLYYLVENVLVTATPAKNLVGFIEGSIKKGPGIGGDKGTGVFRKQ
jgi:hypothetical protein